MPLACEFWEDEPEPPVLVKVEPARLEPEIRVSFNWVSYQPLMMRPSPTGRLNDMFLLDSLSGFKCDFLIQEPKKGVRAALWTPKHQAWRKHHPKSIEEVRLTGPWKFR